MDNPLASRLRPRGCRHQNSNLSNQNEDSPPSQDTRARGSPPDTNPESPSSSSSRPRLSATSESRSNRRPHPYQRQTRSTVNLPLQLPETPPPTPEVPAPAPSTTSRRTARRSLDAASQQRLFLRRNLISSPRLSGGELSAPLSDVSDEDQASAPSNASSATQRRGRGGSGGTRGRGGGGSNVRGSETARIDSLRDRFQPTEARSRSSSASSIIRARLTARISFGQRMGLSASTATVSGNSVSIHATGSIATSNNGAQTGTDRLTRNAARRAAEAIVDQSVPSLVDIDGASVAAVRSEAAGSNQSEPAVRMGVLSGPGWSGTYDRTHGDEITVQIIDFGRIMGIPAHEFQLLNNLQGQFQDMLHRSFHHSITSKSFEDIPQRIVVEEDVDPKADAGHPNDMKDDRVEGEQGEGRSSSTKNSADDINSGNTDALSDDATTSPNVPSAASNAVASETRNCTICLMTPVVNDVLKTLPCDHFFHSDCLKQWFTDHASCPMCRDCALCRISGAFNVQFSPS